MSFQFIHQETYSRASRKEKTVNMKGGRTRVVSSKSSAADIAAEAMREPENSPHVKNPKPPKLIFGEDPRKVVNQIEELAGELKDSLNRKIRKDAQVLSVLVASHPIPMADARDKKATEEITSWIKSTRKWAAEKYGDQLKSIVFHSDESHPHLHIFLQPEDLEISNVHEGISAKKEARKGGGVESQAYKDGMKSFQDDYFEKVSIKHGMTRLGPKIQRLTRKAFIAQKENALTIKNSLDTMQKKYDRAFDKLKQKEKAVTHDQLGLESQRQKLASERLLLEKDRELAVAEIVEKRLPAAVEAVWNDKKKRTALIIESRGLKP